MTGRRHRLYEDGRVDSVDSGIFVHAIVPRHLVFDLCFGIITALLSIANPFLCYWKGTYGHATAEFIAEYYECPDPYSVSEMEEMAIANAAECFDMLGRLISFRVIVNSDLFMDGETPESTWGDQRSFSERVENDNSETLDIFEPAMHNLFNTASVAIEAILAGNM